MAKSNCRNRIETGTAEKGVALVAAMLTLLLISAITAGIIILANSETNTSSNFKDEQRAFFSAKAGFEEVRDRLRTAASNSIKASLPTTLPGGSSSVLYILNPLNSETVSVAGSSATYPDDEICKETNTLSCSAGLPPTGSWYTTTTASSTYASSPVMDWKWSRIQLKQNNAFGANYYVNGANSGSYVCWSSTTPNEIVSATPCVSPNLAVYVVTTLAVTPSGTRRMVQAEVAEDTSSFTAPAALTVNGPGAAFSGGTSAQFGVSGLDVGGCGSAAGPNGVPAVGVVNASDVATVSSSSDIPSKTDKNYSGSGATTPDVENVSSALASNGLNSVSSLQNLVATLQSQVTQPVITGPASGLSNPGTSGAPQTIFVNGDLTITGNTTGYGILVVTGTLTMKGTPNWNGLVVVVGKGDFEMAGTVSINGAVMIANTLDASGNPLSSLGVPTYNVNGGGNGGVAYSASCLAQATQPTLFHVIAFRELMN